MWDRRFSGRISKIEHVALPEPGLAARILGREALNGVSAGLSAGQESADQFENKLAEFAASVSQQQMLPDVPANGSEVEIEVNLEIRHQ